MRVSGRDGRLILATTILASGMAFLDMTVVNVALPRIEEDLGGGLATLQWVLDAYLLTLGALVLAGGSLGDVLGHRRVFTWGVIGFAVTSLGAAVAPTAVTLILARGAQGVAAALLIPGSLALVSSSFAPEERGRAIGIWSGLTALMMAAGPFIGGLLVDSSVSGWRWIFLINLPLAVVVLLLARSIPAAGTATGSGRGERIRDRVDLVGAALTVIGLALIVAPLIEWQQLPGAVTALSVSLGVIVLIGFWLWERHLQDTGCPPPMLPPRLWRIRSFSVANAMTMFVYGALGAVMLLLTIGLQIGLGWSALAAGAAIVPITLVLALLSPRVGALLPRVGSRVLLTSGSAAMALGTAGLALLPQDASYWLNVLPALLVFSVGLALMVAPITTTALGDIPVSTAGVGSGVNNAVARIAGLIAVAVVPLLAGLSGLDARSGAAVLPGYQRAMLISAALLAVGALVAWFGLTHRTGRVEPTR